MLRDWLAGSYLTESLSENCECLIRTACHRDYDIKVESIREVGRPVPGSDSYFVLSILETIFLHHQYSSSPTGARYLSPPSTTPYQEDSTELFSCNSFFGLFCSLIHATAVMVSASVPARPCFDTLKPPIWATKGLLNQRTVANNASQATQVSYTENVCTHPRCMLDEAAHTTSSEHILIQSHSCSST